MDLFTKGDFTVQKHYKELYGSVENLITQAKNGNTSAQADLGFAYCEGLADFVEKDTEKAIGWLDTAVENGYISPPVCGKLGELLDLKGTPHHQRKAYEMYHTAAQSGCPKSQINLAEMYRCGVKGVVNEDIKEAFKWYKNAAGETTYDGNTELGAIGRLFTGTMNKMGNAIFGPFRQKALFLLYKYYLEGDCPEGRPQPTKAVHYLTRAAELGNTKAQLMLGEIYLNGSCEQIKDLKKAKRWLDKAANGDDVRAKELLQQCKLSDDTKCDASEVTMEAFKQSVSIMGDKFRQRAEAKLHPFAISQPVAVTEEMLQQYDWSPTARIYLQAYKLVKEGLEILHKSNFTDERGITLIAHGYLTENSILQAFPQILNKLLPDILKLCEDILLKNPCFFEGLLMSYALHGYKLVSEESCKDDIKVLMCIMNLIEFIQKTEPNSPPCEEPYQFDKNYSSWLHLLYYQLAAIYTISEATEQAAEAFENSLKCCPSYFESKRGLGYSMSELYASKLDSDKKDPSHESPKEFLRAKIKKPQDREVSTKYKSWTAEKVRGTAVKVLKEYLEEAPPCYKTYPNVCYYLADIALVDCRMPEFRYYFEQGQDAEEKRLPFLDPVDMPLKDTMAPLYQHFVNVKERERCGNRACINKFKESDLKSCGRCGIQKYCSKECQKTDWKNHKASCTVSKKPKAKNL